mmetsp:Transcript_1094/g.1869  ORF Transcript_1094/g.1869 Transcript_1094/m.1869 type:complete len:244 (+) Transcript_1094:1129-1860(+)
MPLMALPSTTPFIPADDASTIVPTIVPTIVSTIVGEVVSVEEGMVEHGMPFPQGGAMVVDCGVGIRVVAKGGRFDGLLLLGVGLEDDDESGDDDDVAVGRLLVIGFVEGENDGRFVLSLVRFGVGRMVVVLLEGGDVVGIDGATSGATVVRCCSEGDWEGEVIVIGRNVIGSAVGRLVALLEGCNVDIDDIDGATVGRLEGEIVIGRNVGCFVGRFDGRFDGRLDGRFVGSSVGRLEGEDVVG